MKTTCTICDSETVRLFNTKVLRKYDVDYFKCKNCGFIETEQPYWLKEAYDNAITQLDIGLIWRNQLFSGIVEKFLLTGPISPNGKFLDYGGGYGMFVRMMRDKGFDFYRQDIYCENLFAKHFDITDIPDQKKFDVLTAFEVFEHLENPIEELQKMLIYSHLIVFSTEILPDDKLSPESWWYFAPETGQHISLFTLRSLEILGKKLQLHLYSNGSTLHILSKEKLKVNPFETETNSAPTFYDLLFKRKQKIAPRESLLMKDFEYIKKKISL